MWEATTRAGAGSTKLPDDDEHPNLAPPKVAMFLIELMNCLQGD